MEVAPISQRDKSRPGVEYDDQSSRAAWRASRGGGLLACEEPPDGVRWGRVRARTALRATYAERERTWPSPAKIAITHLNALVRGEWGVGGAVRLADKQQGCGFASCTKMLVVYQSNNNNNNMLYTSAAAPSKEGSGVEVDEHYYDFSNS